MAARIHSSLVYESTRREADPLGTQSRKQREIAAREARLLELAYDLIRQDGLVALQMSEVARAAEIAIGTLYSHFSSKEDLLLALSVRSSALRQEFFQRAVSWQAGTRLRMLALAMADFLFLEANAHYAQIDQYAMTEVVWERASQRRREDFVKAREPIGELIWAVVREARATGELPEAGFAVEETPFGFWTMLVGTHQLTHARGLLEHFQIHEPQRLMVRHLNMWLNGMQWQPLIDPHNDHSLQALCHRLQTEVFAEEAS